MNHYPEKARDFLKIFKGKPLLLPSYSGLYLSEGFRSLGMNLIGLFVPLYILKITGSVAAIFLFYALYHFFVVLSDYPVALLTKLIGIDWVGFLGALTRAGFVFCLLKSQGQPALLWLAAMGWGITITLTWLPFHYAFTVAEHEDQKFGKEVSRYRIVGKITSLVGPVSGGLIIASLGFQSLFSFAIVLIVISGVPLFFDTIKSKGMRLSFEMIEKHLKRRKKRKFWLSFVGGQLESVVLGLAWTLFIFFAVQNYQTLGLIKSGATLASLVLVWFLGQWIDRRGKSILYLGTLINSFNVLLRPFLTNPFALFLVDSAYGIASDLVITPFDSAFFEEAIKMRKLEFMVEREFVIHLSGMMACLLVGLMFVLGVPWPWIFSLGVVGLLMRNYILSE
jgi:hypothetical protein